MTYDFDYFTGRHLTYPQKPARPVLGRNPSAIEARAFADAMEDYERGLSCYEEDMTFYKGEIKRLRNEFVEKLKADYGLCDAEFNVIWQEAESLGNGLHETFIEFDRLFDFVKVYVKAMKGV